MGNFLLFIGLPVGIIFSAVSGLYTIKLYDHCRDKNGLGIVLWRHILVGVSVVFLFISPIFAIVFFAVSEIISRTKTFENKKVYLIKKYKEENGITYDPVYHTDIDIKDTIDPSLTLEAIVAEKNTEKKNHLRSQRIKFQEEFKKTHKIPKDMRTDEMRLLDKCTLVDYISTGGFIVAIAGLLIVM